MRGALLAAITGCWLLTAAAQPISPSQPTVQTLARGSVRSAVGFEVAALGESRLALQFELPLAVTRIVLVDPAGTPRTLAIGSEVRVSDAAQRHQAARGHLHLLLTPLPNPAPGRWRLELEHAPARGGEALWLLASQFPRFELRLAVVGGAAGIGAGTERLIELRASDQGEASVGLQPQGSVLHADSGVRTPLSFWSSPPPALGLPVQPEPGQYFAVFAPDAPGRYTLLAQQDWRGSDGTPQPQQRQIDVDVVAQPVLRTLQVAQPTGPAGCVTRVRFHVDWPAVAPGRYTLTVVLQGAGRTLQFNGGLDAEAAGPLRLEAATGARDLLPLGDAVQVARVDVLHLHDSGATLLQRRRAVPLQPALALERLCR